MTYQVDSRQGKRHAVDGDMPADLRQFVMRGDGMVKTRCGKRLIPAAVYGAEVTPPGDRCPACFGTRKPVEERFAAVSRQVGALIEAAKDEDSWALGDLLRLRDRITAGADEIVVSLRERGTPWETIGAEITNSRTGGRLGKVAARNRFKDRIGELDDDVAGSG